MNWFTERLARFSDQPAVIENSRTQSFGDLLARIEQIKQRFNADTLPSASVIALRLKHQTDTLAALIACAQTQHIALPLAPDLPEPEATAMQRIAGTQWQLTNSDGILALNAERAFQRPAVLAKLAALDHPGLILFSSGTSGQPKGMLHDFHALLNRYSNVKPRTDRTLQLLLVDHIGGLDAALRSLLSGSTLVIPEARTPEAAARAIEMHRINVLPASPTFLNLMLLADVSNRFDCSSLEIIAYGAEAMPTALLERLRVAFPRAELQQKFGTSETGAIRIKSADSNSLFFSIADHDTEWKISDGELWLRTPSRILGYLNADNTSLENDGWYRTGDLVEAGSENRLRIIGRRTEQINIGGQKVHPSEIESVLMEHPEIHACRAFSRPDAITGQAISCEIFSPLERSPQEWKRLLRSHCRGCLAPWKIPSVVYPKKNYELGITARMKRQSTSE